LRQRHAEARGGRLIGPAEERVTFEELAADHLRDYRVRGLRSAATAEQRVKRLRSSFGADRGPDITTDRIRAYQAWRLEAGAQGATVNREPAALGRMVRLAARAGRLSACPVGPPRLEERPREFGAA
jgi:hypothetical protein